MTYPADSRRLWRALLLLLVVQLAAGLSIAEARWARQVVLSEVYGGGGNSGAAYERDFIELYNPTVDPISLEGWSVQYASAKGGFTEPNVIPLYGTIPPFGSYLVAGASGSSGAGAPLPAPDVESNVELSATNGKVALARSTEALSGPDDPNVADFLGYGTANAFEGDGPAPKGSNALSLQRLGDGASDPSEGTGTGWDTEQNSLDWVAAPPTPRNSQDPPLPPQPPVAVIVVPLTSSSGEPVELDGGASWDPGGDPLTFRWLLIDRPPGSLASLTDPTASLTTLVPDEVGRYQVELVVSDGLLESASARATLAVRSNAGSLVSHGPNPARDQVVFFYRGEDAATLQVYDAAGRRIHQARLDAGPMEYRWGLISNGGRPIAAGLYLYLALTEGGDRSPLQRLVVER